MRMETTPQTRRDLLAMIGTAGTGAALFSAIPALAAEPAGPSALRIETATEQNVEPYGWLLGKSFPTAPGAIAFRTPTVVSTREQLFDPGKDGEVEVVWVDYSGNDPVIARLEQHYLTQQAVVPLTGDIVQIVALSRADGAPDLSTLRAFRLSPGIGLCMRPGLWHTTRSKGAKCLMLTRASTSVDIINHIKAKTPLSETVMLDIPPVRLIPAPEA